MLGLPSRLLDLALPPRCLGCKELLSHGRAFCTPCAVTLLPRGASCLRCGRPASEALSPTGPCGPCLLEPSPFTRVTWAFEHGGAARDAIVGLKYGGRTELARRLVDLADLQLHTDVERVLPIPLHGHRLAERGYNQAGLLARHVARRLKVTVAWDALERTRVTSAQVGLSAAARRANVHGAFSVADPEVVHGRAVLLVDDVVTTGATARECAQVLRAAGAARVDLFSMTRDV